MYQPVNNMGAAVGINGQVLKAYPVNGIPLTPGPGYPILWPDHPIEVTCIHCGQHGLTHVDMHVGKYAWCLCLIMCLIGFWPCMFIPFCVTAMNE